MALYYDLKVFKDVYQLILKIFEYTKDFPREYKYTLGQDMKRDAIILVRSIYRANKTKSKTEISTMVIRTTTIRTIQTGSVLFGVLNKPVTCPDKLLFGQGVFYAVGTFS